MSLTPWNRQEEWYQEMIDAAGSGGLPPVTTSDAGKVLSVNNSGVWGAEFLDRNVLIIEPVGGKSPYSASEIDEIAKAGVFVVFISVYNNISKVYVYAGLTNGNAYFSRIYNRETTETIAITENKTVGSAGVIRIYQKPLTGIPETDLAQTVKDKLNKFVVTLTPTAQDYSGTMDKTPQEITAAHEAGQEIVFNIVGYPSFDSVQINADWFTYATGRTYCAACATLVDLVGDMQIGIFTADIADTKTYNTKIYPLTPAT